MSVSNATVESPSYLRRAYTQVKSWAKTLKREVIVLNHAYHDPRCPLAAKVVAVATIAYALSPIDLIPDFIPVLGQLDDLILVPAGLYLAIKLIPKEVIDDARKKVVIEGEKLPKNKAAAVCVVGIWAASALGVARYFDFI
jgi:uncharacterized membrane protein YkvA (DUF1232 family)